MNQSDVLTNINRQIDEQSNILIWQQESDLLNQNTAKKIIIFSITGLIICLLINPPYALLALIFWLILLPILLSVYTPKRFWHYDKPNHILRLYQKTEMLKEIDCNHLMMSVRTSQRGGARWTLVSPKMGDIEDLLITSNGFFSRKGQTLFVSTANRLAQYMHLQRTHDF